MNTPIPTGSLWKFKGFPSLFKDNSDSPYLAWIRNIEPEQTVMLLEVPKKDSLHCKVVVLPISVIGAIHVGWFNDTEFATRIV